MTRPRSGPSVSGPSVLTRRQLRRLQALPGEYKVVSARDGIAIVERADGQTLRLQPNGRLVASTLIESVQSYLRVQRG